jgi:hypothetical protein
MVIDQRNAGASTTPTTGGTYNIDRWQTNLSQASKFSIQQNAGSVTPPAGFTNYLGVTSLSAYSITSSDLFFIEQDIEGFNMADFNWGAANARTVTLSFWVYSSLTGTFGGSLRNSSGGRSYPFGYTISAANTWEYKTVTITGDTSGTWLTTNGIGIRLSLSIGSGSNWAGTAGAWNSNNNWTVSGAVSVVGTSGATFYITGVQLEVGSSATSFEYRPYGTELQLCQRYCQVVSRFEEWVYGSSAGTSNAAVGVLFIQAMRASPTVTLAPAGSTAGTMSFLTSVGSTPSTVGTHAVIAVTNYGFRINANGYTGAWSSAGLGTGLYAYSNPTNVYTASAEL